MLKLMEDQRVAILPNFQGGLGAAEVRYIAEENDYVNPHLFMVAQVTLQPGATVGDHAHTGLTEVIYILDGLALYSDGTERILKPGDAAIVAESERQSIRSANDKPLTYLACIAHS